MTGHLQRDMTTSLRHLQAELARIDVRIRRQVRRWQLAGQDPGDGFRGLHLVGAEIEDLLARPFAASWGEMVTLDPGETQALAQAEASLAAQARALSARAREEGQIPRLEWLAETFGLDRFDVDTLLVCLAPALDLRYERLYAYLQDDVTRKRPTVNLVLDLLSDGDAPRRLSCLLRFGPEAPLFRHWLVEQVPEQGNESASLLGQALAVDPALVCWLLGGYQPHADLAGHAVLSTPDETEADRLLGGRGMEHASLRGCLLPGGPLAVFYGADEVSQEAAARLFAARAGRPLLRVDLAAVVGAGASPLDALRLALRDARLTGALPFLAGWDALLPVDDLPSGERDAQPNPAPRAAGGGRLVPSLLGELCDFPGPAVVAGRSAWQAGGLDRERGLLWLEFPVPAWAQRQALWSHYLPDPSALALDGDGLDVSILAGQFALTTGQIRDAVVSARDTAAQQGVALRAEHILAAARSHSNPRLSSLARKIVPRFAWEDIVLPDDQCSLLHEIVATIRGRSLVLETWGVGRKLASSAGVTMLFSGEPGTGKTMAAEVMANELGLDLYKIDLSTVVSKYIGETEKNLERIFSEAQSSNAILFFDEADAIFGKRSEVKDAHDRYANIEISYLLQRMEAYEGVTILATNLRANLDEAFTRRLQFAVDFPFPDEGDRLRIWRTLFPPGVPREADLDLELLARRFKLAGGNIRNILVGAAYLAASDGGRVGMKHLLHGTRRELQKMGRLVKERDMLLGGDNA